MDIYQLLPLLKGWKRYCKELSNITVKGGEEKVLFEATDKGWIVASGFGYYGDEYSLLRLEYHDRYGEKHILEMQPRALKLAGIGGLGSFHGVRLAYTNGELHVLTLSPERPIPYYADIDHPLRFIFKAVTDCNISWFAYEVVVIVDESAFRRSLSDLFVGYTAKLEVIKA